MRKLLIVLFLIVSIVTVSPGVIDNLLDVSVTIRAGNNAGSGTVFLIQDSKGKNVNIILTAAHVVIGARITNQVVINNVTNTSYVFSKIDVMKILRKDQFPIGSIQYSAEVIKFSDHLNGHDIAILKIEDQNPWNSAKFSENLPRIGSEIYFIGSLMGLVAPNALTKGVYSSYNRDIGGFTYDICNVTGFSGGSGGGVFGADGVYLGMVTRVDQGLSIIVPVRRIKEFCKQKQLEWVVNPGVKLLSESDIKKIVVED